MDEDAGARTQQEVATLSLREEFDRYREQYRKMQEVLADAQRQLYEGAWRWNGGDDIPQIGGDGTRPLAGADTHNTYALTSSRSYDPEGAEGARSDLDPMIDYFTANSWSFHVERVGRTYYLDGFTDDGWRIEYLVQQSGHYSLTVYSDLFWTNDADALSEAVGGRAGGRHPAYSRPGEYPDPPTWDSPIISPPKI
ncbi:hypothetical protein [Curtobacterium sp. MCBD17_030]|uniref:hypothetical protein n=1 Tax=Curtobacterium sp. MCBD17_030 TaxID=2175649 RepID=UPI0015E87B1F|nr:hypothetical protein [Curtobacterium sp. MCBD17_030]